MRLGLCYGSGVTQSSQRIHRGDRNQAVGVTTGFFFFVNLQAYFHNTYPNENLKLLILYKSLMELLKGFKSYHVSLIYLG